MRLGLHLSLGLRLARPIGEEVVYRCPGLASYQLLAERLSPCNHLIDRPKDDRITGVLDDHLTALSKAVLLSEFSRQADPAVRHYFGFHGVTSNKCHMEGITPDARLYAIKMDECHAAMRGRRLQPAWRAIAGYRSRSIRRSSRHCAPGATATSSNRDIVDATTALISAPNGHDARRSGTWSTVRYARRLGRVVTVIMPNGGVVAP
jgi:hypothetical protein